MNEFFSNPTNRRWIYGVISAAIPVLVGLGFMAGEDSQMWMNLAAAVLGLSASTLALPNTPAAQHVTVEHDESTDFPDGTGRHRAE